MLRKAFIDDQLAARQFNTGETVRKSGLRGFLLSPYAGRVLYSNVDTGIVQVQWPWGSDLEFASELVHDVSFTTRPPSTDQSYSTLEGARSFNDSGNVESDQEWRSSLASEIVAGYEDRTLPVYRAACKAMHDGLDEVTAFVTLSKVMAEEFGTDTVRRTVANLYEAGRRMAIYWVDPSRQYRVTQKEKNGGVLACPRCRGTLKPRTFRQGKKVLLCKGCGFTIHPKDLQK